MAPIPTARTEPTPTGPTGPTEPRRSAPDQPLGALAELIGEGAVAGFLQGAFGKDAWRTRQAPEVLRAWFDWATLNRALAEHRLGPPRLRLERAAQDVSREALKARRTRRGETLHDLDPAALTKALRDGATLILDAAQELSPPLQRLCARLAADFACAVQANLYACWGTTQGFDVHWDDHDVFVLQVEGTKTWRLYGSTREAPTRLDFHADHPKPETPIEEVLLTPGDVLYLPRGYWHAAVGRGEPTLHLTVGLTRRTGADLLHWLADRLLSEAAVRTDLPLEKDDAALAAQIAGVLAQVHDADPGELARAYRRHLAATQSHRPKLSFPFLGRTDEPLSVDAPLTLADGTARLQPAEKPRHVVLSWRGTEFTVADELAPALRSLVAGGVVTLADLEAMLPERDRPLARDLVADLIGRGVLVTGRL